MRGGQKQRVGVVRLMLAAIKQREIDERIQLSDEQVLLVLDKMVKQRRESIHQYQAAGRDDLVAVESAEIDIIQQYLPEPLDSQEIEALIIEATAEVGAKTLGDMGAVMAILKPRMQGRADLAQVSQRVKSLLGA